MNIVKLLDYETGKRNHLPALLHERLYEDTPQGIEWRRVWETRINGFDLKRCRLSLPSEKPFSRKARYHCLEELEEMIIYFSLVYGMHTEGSKSYTYRERSLLAHIRRALVRLLKDTPSYYEFSRSKAPESEEAVFLREDEEIWNQRYDEQQLRVLPLSIYAPRSKKYKELKKREKRERMK